MIYNEEFETLPREVLDSLQLKRLKNVVERVYHTVGFYRKKFDEAGVTPEDIHCLDDLKRLPSPPSRTCATTILSGFSACP